MTDAVDAVIAQRLRHRIGELLNGTREQPGHYRLAAVGVRSWEDYQKLVGRIQGFEMCLGLIDEVLGQLDSPEHDRQSRIGLN